ncbi:MAG: hypothetical protein RL199_404 [Pseudomonadota bacterium]
MQKQVWIFLTPDDEAALIEELRARAPIRLLRGRFFRGTVDDLRTNPEALETKAARRGESIVHLLHAEASRTLVAEPVTDGPFAGWTRLDEVRSEVVTIVRPEPEPQGLGPARVQASTHAWFSGTRLRKSPGFGRWVNDVLGVVSARPATAFDWMHAADGARALAGSGGVLHYLYRPVALTAEAGTPATRPHKGR